MGLHEFIVKLHMQQLMSELLVLVFEEIPLPAYTTLKKLKLSQPK